MTYLFFFLDCIYLINHQYILYTYFYPSQEMCTVEEPNEEFTSRHSLEWKFLFLDHRYALHFVVHFSLCASLVCFFKRFGDAFHYVNTIITSMV